MCSVSPTSGTNGKKEPCEHSTLNQKSGNAMLDDTFFIINNNSVVGFLNHLNTFEKLAFKNLQSKKNSTTHFFV